MLFPFEKRHVEEEANLLEILINEVVVALLSVTATEESWISQSLTPSKSRQSWSYVMEQMILMNNWAHQYHPQLSLGQRARRGKALHFYLSKRRNNDVVQWPRRHFHRFWTYLCEEFTFHFTARRKHPKTLSFNERKKPLGSMWKGSPAREWNYMARKKIWNVSSSRITSTMTVCSKMNQAPEW
jgi:hypothetical protein